MSVVKSVQLFFQEGSSDKVYNATIVKDGDAYTVKVEWGRRGSSLQQGSKAVKVPLAAATKKYESLVREKTNKGYQEFTVAVKPAAVAPPEGEGSGSRVAKRAKVGFSAQLLSPIEEDELAAFLQNEEMVAQQKIDGQRVIAHVTADEIIVTNRDGQRTTKIPASMFAGLEYLPHGTVVDGEVLDDGYWLFDVLQLGDEDVRERGYADRYDILDGELEPALSGDIRIVPMAQGKKAKQKLHDRLRAGGAEGLVFKHRDAPYTAGRVATQRKLKFTKTADVVVLENAGNAYLMAVYDGRKLFEIGKVFSGTTNATRKQLDAALAKKQTPIVEVRYLYATKDHQLTQPVFVRIRDDKPAGQCLREQLATTCRTVIV